jgi:hypothetical protein
VRCPTRKVRYPSQIDAKLALVRTRAKDRDEKRYYYCRQCGGYHLTSKEWKPWLKT